METRQSGGSVVGRAARIDRWARESPLAVDLLIAVGLGLVGAPLTVWMLVSGRIEEDLLASAPSTQSGWLAVEIAAVVIGHGTLALRRVWPTGSFLVVATAVAAQAVITPWLVLPSMLIVLPSVYSVAAYGRTTVRGPAIGLVVSVVGSMLVTGVGVVIVRPPEVVEPLTYGFLRLLPGLLVLWCLGLVRRARVTYAARLAVMERDKRVREAVTEERTRIAREMHDVIAHALSVVVSQANGGRYAVRSDPERAPEILGTIARTGQQALADTRGMLAMLRTDTPADALDPPAMQPSVDDLPALLDRVRAAGMAVDLEERGDRTVLATPVQLAVYRVVQEALTNSLKHAGPDVQSKVSLTWHPDGLELVVTDNGTDSAIVGQEGGQGLIGMRERVGMIGGTVSAGSLPNGGFAVRAWLPVNVQEDVS